MPLFNFRFNADALNVYVLEIQIFVLENEEF